MGIFSRAYTGRTKHVITTMRTLTILFSLFMAVVASAQQIKPEKIRPSASFNFEIREPSDIVFNPLKGTLFVVSDNGYLAETTLEGKRIRASEEIGYDIEGVTLRGNDIVLVDEFTRVIGVYDRDFNRLRNVRVNYSGGRNSAFEAITWIPEHRTFVTLTEKNPIWVFVLNEDFVIQDEFELPIGVRDISAATWHQGHIWLLSDDDRTVFKCTYPRFDVVRAWRLPIINPEGLTFDSKGNLLVCSDDRERLYVFDASHFAP